MARLRAKFLTLHRRIGLVLAALWIVQGLTGCLLVFEPELQRAALPPVRQGPMASLNVIARNAAAAAGTRVERIKMLDRQGDLLGAEYVGPADHWRVMLVEAATGRPLETIERDPTLPDQENIWRWLYTLHTTLLSGSSGKVIIGFSGLVLLTSILLGLRIGWPARGAWKTAFHARRWRTASQRLYGWHRAIGLSFALMLIVIPVTGAYMACQQQADAVAARMIPFHLPYVAKPIVVMPAIRVLPQAAYLLARRLFPDARFESIVLPTPDHPVYTVCLRQPGESRVWIGTTSVVIDPTSGRVLDSYDAVHAPLANRLSDAAYPVHIGEIAGLPGRLLTLLSGVSLVTLGVIGLSAWWRKRRRTHTQRSAGSAVRTPTR